MSNRAPTDNARRMVCELLDGLASASSGVDQSVGLFSPGRDPQPPAHCLRLCLGGDAGACGTRGCTFLAGAAQGRVDFAALEGGRCPQGLHVSTHQTTVGTAPATFITLAGDWPSAAAPATPVSDPGSGIVPGLESASHLVDRIEQLIDENAGFANELLRTYEQLSLVFDLTQALADITDPREIERVLLENIRRVLNASFAALWVDGEATVRSAPDGETALIAPEAAATLCDQVRRSGQVRVTTLDGRELIAGPLARLESAPDVVIGGRASARGVFNAGDALLMESALSFGGQLRSNAALHERLRRTATDVTRALVSAIDKKDAYTRGHSERVGLLTRLTAAELGVPAVEQQTMEWAGLLHDIGKIGVPERILCKPGKLTDEEFDAIKQHPRMGYEILKPIGCLQLILDGVLSHHEYTDGTGYPDGLVGDAIPLVARIIHVVDAFDALTSDRAYRRGFTLSEAFAKIDAERGTRSDPRVIDAVRAALRRFAATDPTAFLEQFPCGREMVHAAD